MTVVGNLLAGLIIFGGVCRLLKIKKSRQSTPGHSLPFCTLLPSLVIASLIFGAGITAFLGTALAGRLSNAQLERVILVLLMGIGTALIIEGFLPFRAVGFCRTLWPSGLLLVSSLVW